MGIVVDHQHLMEKVMMDKKKPFILKVKGQDFNNNNNNQTENNYYMTATDTSTYTSCVILCGIVK